MQESEYGGHERVFQSTPSYRGRPNGSSLAFLLTRNFNPLPRIEGDVGGRWQRSKHRKYFNPLPRIEGDDNHVR